MTWRAAAPLAKPLKFFERQVEARDMQQGVEKRASMSGRENEAVPVRPQGVIRIELEQAVPECIRHGGRAQGKTRVP
jgi:hypothetical protein